MPMAKESPVSSSRERVLYLELSATARSANTHDVSGAPMVKGENGVGSCGSVFVYVVVLAWCGGKVAPMRYLKCRPY